MQLYLLMSNCAMNIWQTNMTQNLKRQRKIWGALDDTPLFRALYNLNQTLLTADVFEF